VSQPPCSSSDTLILLATGCSTQNTLQSANRRYVLRLLRHGHLVLEDTLTGQQQEIGGPPGSVLCGDARLVLLMGSGALVVLSASNQAVWSSQSECTCHTSCYSYRLTDDGELQVRACGACCMYAAQCATGLLYHHQTLSPTPPPTPPLGHGVPPQVQLASD
jgi:hypothetical protein